MINIEEMVFSAFHKLDIDNPQLHDHLEDNLSMDSQEVISLIVQLEKLFGINLNLNDINKNMTILQVIEHIKKNYKVA